MLKNRREKLLAVMLAGIVVLTLGHDLISGVLLQPLDTRTRRISELHRRVSEREFEYTLLRRAQNDLKSAAQRSLPADPTSATLEYENWLVETAGDIGLTGVAISPGRPIEEESIGHRIPFAVSCDGAMVELAEFLDRFQSTDILHRITYLTAVPEGGSDSDTVRLTVNIEAIALAQAQPRSELFVPKTETRTDKLRNLIAAGNPFARHQKAGGRSKKKRSRARQSRKDKNKVATRPASTMRLIACIDSGGTREAWLFDASTGKQFLVNQDDSITHGEMHFQVATIGTDHVILSRDGTQQRIALGDALSGLDTN